MNRYTPNRNLFLCIGFVFYLSAGCAGIPVDLYPAENLDEGVELIYISGAPVAVSVKEGSVMAFAADEAGYALIRLHVFCANQGSENINFIPEGVSVRAIDLKGKQYNAYALTADEYLANIGPKPRSSVGEIAIASAMQQASLSGETKEALTTSSRGGAANIVSITSQPDFGDPDPTSNAKKGLFRNIKLKQFVEYAATGDGILKRVTLLSGYYVEGAIIIRLARDPSSYSCGPVGDIKNILVSMPIGNQKHEVAFNILTKGKRLESRRVSVRQQHVRKLLVRKTLSSPCANDIEFRAAEVLFDAGDYGGAMQKASAIIDEDPQCCEALKLFGDCHLVKDKESLALESYKKAFECNPKDLNLRDFMEALDSKLSGK